MNLILQAIKSLFRKMEIRLAKAEKYCVQTNWNQNDPTSPDYVKNRPFYEIPSVWTTANITEYEGHLYIDHALELDKPYTVRIDGVVYSFDSLTQGGYHSASGYYIWYLGAKCRANGIVDNWDYPFSIFAAGNSDIATDTEVKFEDGSSNHTIEFIKSEGEIHHIEPKYIKDMYYEEEGDVIYAEAVIPEDMMYLPEATYEIGKTYTIEVNGKREEFVFTYAYASGVRRYRVGFNIADGNQGVYVADKTKGFYMVSGSGYDAAPNGEVNCELEFKLTSESTITFPANVKILRNGTVVHQINPKYIKDMYYEEDNSAKLSVLVSDFGHAPNWTPYKVGPLPTRVNFEEPFSLKVDGILYTFERFTNDGQVNAIGLNQRRIGAPIARGQITDASEYPFTLIVFLEEEQYAHIAFADCSQNHTVEIPNVKLKKLDAKYLPEYDAVIKESVVVNDDGETAEATLLSGSYDAVVGRIKANELPRVLCVSEFEDAEVADKHVAEVRCILTRNKADNMEVLLLEAVWVWAMLPDGTLELT